MKKSLYLLALALFAAAAPVKAGTGSDLLEERYKAALNEMVQQVRHEQDPEAKRAILKHFIDHMSDGLQKAEGMESISEPDRQTLHVVAGKFYAYQAELNGQAGYTPVPDASLDQFAGYIQEGMEQAPMGGIYISGGALIVILILLIILL
jgi:hypothetical protein